MEYTTRSCAERLLTNLVFTSGTVIQRGAQSLVDVGDVDFGDNVVRLIAVCLSLFNQGADGPSKVGKHIGREPSLLAFSEHLDYREVSCCHGAQVRIDTWKSERIWNRNASDTGLDNFRVTPRVLLMGSAFAGDSSCSLPIWISIPTMSLRSQSPGRSWQVVAVMVLVLTACSSRKDRPRATYVPVSELERSFGPLVAAGNHPTPNQYGTGDRLGLFRDSKGTIWGIPLVLAADGRVLGCAPPTVHDAPVTDTYPADATVLAATNEPTGWRSGTGKLELLLRDTKGGIQWRSVNGSHIDIGPICWAQEPPGPKQPLLYYRLASVAPQK